VRCHATNGPVKDLGRSAVMKGARLFGIDDMPLVKEVVITELQRLSRVKKEYTYYT
jgi:hypothetical protein